MLPKNPLSCFISLFSLLLNFSEIIDMEEKVCVVKVIKLKMELLLSKESIPKINCSHISEKKMRNI